MLHKVVVKPLQDGNLYSIHSYKIQQSPDNQTMLNHTTLLFAPNLPRIKWNVNKFALIIAQKSPDNHTILFQLSTFIAFINKFLSA